MALREPLAAFLADFGCTVTTAGGSTFTAIFDREAVQLLGGYGGGIDASQPMLMCRTVDVVANAVREGSTLTLPSSGEASFADPTWWGGSQFTVRAVRPDGQGMTALVLEVAAA